MATNEKPDDLLSTYDALDYLEKKGKKTSLLTLERWVDETQENPNDVPAGKRLLPAATIKVGTTRTMNMFSRSSLDAWTPGRRDGSKGVKKAADLLGITDAAAQRLFDSKGKDGKRRNVKVAD